jgi:signal transduction histidine kinase
VWFSVPVSQDVARVPVLPREIAAGVTVNAVSRSARAIAAGVLLVTLIGVFDLFNRMGYANGLFVPVVSIVVMLAVVLAATIRPSRITFVIWILGGALCIYVFLYSILSMHPTLFPHALVLINRPVTAIVLIGAIGVRPLTGVAWGFAGFLAGMIAGFVVFWQLGLPFNLGNGPTIVFANYAAVFLALALAQRAQRGRVPDYLSLRNETRRLETVRTIEQRAAALLHDTVLNDLALVINGPDTLDDRMRDRMRADIATLEETDLHRVDGTVQIMKPGDASVRNQLMSLVSDFQWRGLTVEVTGDQGGPPRLGPDVAAAAVGALRACLENVLAHSGTKTAEVIVSATDASLTWTVSDAGSGFETSDIAADRLGLRSSVLRRVESVGGAVKIWSARGSGTSVLITVPRLPLEDDDDA